jgi:hypothetical protein
MTFRVRIPNWNLRDPDIKPLQGRDATVSV